MDKKSRTQEPVTRRNLLKKGAAPRSRSLPRRPPECGRRRMVDGASSLGVQDCLYHGTRRPVDLK
jgi:hypothetical protein